MRDSDELVHIEVALVLAPLAKQHLAGAGQPDFVSVDLQDFAVVLGHSGDRIRRAVSRTARHLLAASARGRAPGTVASCLRTPPPPPPAGRRERASRSSLPAP